MPDLSFDCTAGEEERRRRIFDGQIFAFSPSPLSTELAAFIRNLADEAFAPLDPREAWRDLPRTRYASLAADLELRTTRDPGARTLLRALCASHACDPLATFFSPPRLLIVSAPGEGRAGSVRGAVRRETWHGALPCEVVWWLPLHALDPHATIAFHVAHWARPVNLERDAWQAADSPRCGSPSRGGEPTSPASGGEPLDNTLYRVTVAPGGIVCHSSAQLYSLGATPTAATLALSFGTVHLDDLRGMSGAPMVDARHVPSRLSRYRRIHDLAPVPEDVAALHHGRDRRLASAGGPARLDAPRSGAVRRHGPPARRASHFTSTA